MQTANWVQSKTELETLNMVTAPDGVSLRAPVDEVIWNEYTYRALATKGDIKANNGNPTRGYWIKSPSIEDAKRLARQYAIALG